MMTIKEREGRGAALMEVLKFVQAAPNSVSQFESGERFAKYIIEAAEALGLYIEEGKK